MTDYLDHALEGRKVSIGLVDGRIVVGTVGVFHGYARFFEVVSGNSKYTINLDYVISFKEE